MHSLYQELLLLNKSLSIIHSFYIQVILAHYSKYNHIDININLTLDIILDTILNAYMAIIIKGVPNGQK